MYVGPTLVELFGGIVVLVCSLLLIGGLVLCLIRTTEYKTRNTKSCKRNTVYEIRTTECEIRNSVHDESFVITGH